jgi:glycosyltransferase involved in cell wall biosynthesis
MKSGSRRIVQLVPAFHQEDAIGQHIRTIHDYFQAVGWESFIVALQADPTLASTVTPWSPDLARQWAGAVWILHYALPSVLTEFFKQAPGRRVLVYHNITPPEYFLPWSAELAFLAQAGRRELQGLREFTDWAVADSHFNAEELRAMGYDAVDVLPILVDWSRYPAPSPWAASTYIDPFYDYWLFVGRVVPNKKVEALLRLIFWYRKFYRNSTRLLVVGKLTNTPRYVQWLYALRAALHLTAQDVAFLGPLPYEDLAACYAQASLFITLSDHEGFCLPVLEAMHYGTPVVAYAAGALPETVGPAGALVYTRDPIVLSEWLEDFLERHRRDPSYRTIQQAHLQKFEAGPYLIRFREQLEVLG